MLKVKIRKFRLGDEFAVAKTIRAANTITLKDYYSPQIIKRQNAEATVVNIRKKAKEKNFHVAVVGGKVVGVIGLTDNRVRSFFVHPIFQGKGIGGKLLQYIEKKIKKRDYRFIQLNSSLFAVPFYKHFGYKKIKSIKPSKQTGRWFEVMLMKKFFN